MWIASNAKDDSTWHFAVRHEARTAKTAKLVGVYFKARCNAKTLGGAYGYSRAETPPEHARVCVNCRRLSAG